MHSTKIRMAILMIVGVTSLLSLPAIAYEMITPDVPEGVCVQNCDDISPSPGYSDDSGSTPEYDDSAERAEHEARLDAKNVEATAAYNRGDYREALRLYYEQQQLRDGPKVQQSIAAAKEMIARTEAAQQAERERLDREARQRVIDEQNRRQREIEDFQTAQKMREKIEAFAASLDTAPPTAGMVVTEGGAAGDALGTHKANAPLAFGNPDTLEASAEQSRQGLDKDGPLMGPEPVSGSIGDPASHDPKMIAAEKELAELGVERAKLDKEIDEIQRERNTELDPKKMKKLTIKLEKKYEAKAEKLLDIYHKEEKNKKLRLKINTRVAGEKEKSK